ncbi:hypothetical protein [Nonomuraea wenchangensis]|uniref:hypothetical protein n=1 Tax=Nonomuraea wenchangensis TaxID=568860 RepID=UPI0011606352|nr:hypothetical protein [Nonomuraea wenchangensis]
MIHHLDLDTAAPALHDIELVAEPRLNAPASPPRLKERVSLGAVVRALTVEEAAAGEEEWSDFLKTESPHSDYFMLSLVCAFRPTRNGDPFVDAAVGIQLESPGKADDQQPIAWSISPKKRLVPARRAARIALTAKLAIVESSVEFSPEGEHEELFVVGMGERDSDPEWRFRKTSSTPLIGDETLTVIVKTSAGAPTQARISVAATVRHRHLGVIPYRAELPPVLRIIDLRSQ